MPESEASGREGAENEDDEEEIDETVRLSMARLGKSLNLTGL